MKHNFRIILSRLYIRKQSRYRDDDSYNRWHNTTKKPKTAGESKSADPTVNRPFIDLPGIHFAIDTIQAWNGVVNALNVFVMQYRFV